MEKEQQQGVLAEILKTIRKRYEHINEIQTTTRELEEALSRNDRVAAQMIISMRQKEIDAIKEIDRKIYYLKRFFPSERQTELEQLLKGKEGCMDLEAGPQILELIRQMKRRLEQTIELDRKISRRVAGKDSYYSKSEL